MSIRPDARRWFLSKYGETKNKIYTSKFYTANESWSKEPVWWPQIPLAAIDRNRFTHVNLLCQIAPGKNNFHYLKVPTSYLNENLEKFHRIGDLISLYLSTEPEKLFVEQRGEGELDFGIFLIKEH